MKRLPLLLLQLFAYPLLGAAQSDTPDSQVESPGVENRAPVDFKIAIAPLLNKYCTSCHGGEKPKSDLSLEFGDDQDVRQRLVKDRTLFERMAQRIRLGEMPPDNRPKPNEVEKVELVTWIDRDVLGMNRGGSHDLASEFPEKVAALAALYDSWAQRTGVKRWVGPQTPIGWDDNSKYKK